MLALVYGPTAVVLLALHLVAARTRVAVGDLTRDPLQLLGVPFYIGLLSNLGILVGCAGAAICIFAGASLPKVPEHRGMRRFLVWTGILTAILVVDDLFMLHDIAIPDYLHVREQFVYMGYVAAGAAYYVVFRRVLWASGAPLVVVAVVSAGVSVLMDQGHAIYVVFGSDIVPTNYLLEDGAKFVSVVSWAAYGILRSSEAIGQVRGEAGVRQTAFEAPAPSSDPGETSDRTDSYSPAARSNGTEE